jgi:hypothetical protein
MSEMNPASESTITPCRRRVSKAFRPTTTQADPTRQLAENILDRDFTADVPNRRWVTTLAPSLAVMVNLSKQNSLGIRLQDFSRRWDSQKLSVTLSRCSRSPSSVTSSVESLAAQPDYWD